MGDGLGAVVADGNVLLAAALAVLAGAVSFASPCVLPLVPGFLGYVTGMGEAAVPRTAGRPAESGSAATAATRAMSAMIVPAVSREKWRTSCR